MKKGEMDMANIYEFITKSNDRRPVYTSYELSKMVRDRRKDSGQSISEFALKNEVDENILKQIELGSCSFSPKIYRVCGNILGLSSKELLAEFIDDIEAVNYRANDNGKGVQETFEMANMLFNEIIMQKKIGIN